MEKRKKIFGMEEDTRAIVFSKCFILYMLSMVSGMCILIILQLSKSRVHEAESVRFVVPETAESTSGVFDLVDLELPIDLAEGDFKDTVVSVSEDGVRGIVCITYVNIHGKLVSRNIPAFLKGQTTIRWEKRKQREIQLESH